VFEENNESGKVSSEFVRSFTQSRSILAPSRRCSVSSFPVPSDLPVSLVFRPTSRVSDVRTSEVSSAVALFISVTFGFLIVADILLTVVLCKWKRRRGVMLPSPRHVPSLPSLCRTHSWRNYLIVSIYCMNDQFSVAELEAGL
jgi:hypothetical protein